MNATKNKVDYSSFDLMVIRAGGRSETEKQHMIQRAISSDTICLLCGRLADWLYKIVRRLEAIANRPTETSHLRFAS